MVQAEGSSKGGDTYEAFFSGMIFILVLSGLMDFSDIVMLSGRPSSCCQQNLNPKSTGLFPPGAALRGFFSTHLCKIRYRHPRKLKFTRLIAYLMFYKICKFEGLTIINDVIMTSLPKTMGKFGISH